MRIRVASAVGLLAVALATATPSGALGADRIYWGNGTGFSISYAALDGSGGATLRSTSGNTQGLGIDLATNRMYWAENGSNLIRVGNLDGSGASSGVNTTGTTVAFPLGAALDPAAGRFYWTNHGPDGIAFARVDGSGGGLLTTTGATVNNPEGPAVDPGAGRIYWANFSANKISFANLDGSGGGGDLSTTGATVNGPNGVAIDAAGGRIYWTNQNGNKISFANLDGSGGGGDLNTTGATVNGPRGLAIDAVGGRIYWANGSGTTISYANLNGSGGGDLPTTSATVNGPTYPVLLKAPHAEGVPVVSGETAVGSMLACTTGSWGGDLHGAFLYQAPQSFSYQWSRDGADISGATGDSTIADVPGDYRCTVTALNVAGATAQTSAPHAVVANPPPPNPPSNQFTIGKLKRNRHKGTGRLPVTVPSAGMLTLSGKGVVSRRPQADRAQRVSVGGAGTVTLKVKAAGKARRKLNQRGKVRLRATLTFTPQGGAAAQQAKTLKLKKRR